MFFLVLSTEAITVGPFTLTAERNYAENLLMLVCALMTCQDLWRRRYGHDRGSCRNAVRRSGRL